MNLAPARSQPPGLSLSSRIRRTPFTARVEACGLSAYTVYNHMLLPTVFRSVEEDYRHLKSAVQVWDVACERQVEVQGPDARRLLEMLTPRDLSRLTEGRCLYVPMVDDRGGMLNDPVAVALAPDRYWISIADSDLLFWVKGIALGLRLNVTVFEPAVSPLAVQGPLADTLMARVFGDAVPAIGFFRYARLDFQGHEVVVARSGYSRQGGFELYVEGSSYAEALWDALFEAGRDLDVRAGGPNLIERIEGGLLSYGNDMTAANTPFECGLGRFCARAEVMDCIGAEALRRAAADGPARQIRGLRIDARSMPLCREPWPVRMAGRPIGRVTSAAWSPDLSISVAIAMIDRVAWDDGTCVSIETPTGSVEATVGPLPFIA